MRGPGKGSAYLAACAPTPPTLRSSARSRTACRRLQLESSNAPKAPTTTFPLVGGHEWQGAGRGPRPPITSMYRVWEWPGLQEPRAAADNFQKLFITLREGGASREGPKEQGTPPPPPTADQTLGHLLYADRAGVVVIGVRGSAMAMDPAEQA